MWEQNGEGTQRGVSTEKTLGLPKESRPVDLRRNGT
jgi:hypothetical protein